MVKQLRIDPDALAMIEDYRKRFSSAPLGVWVDCIDDFMAIGFSGISGKFSRTEFRDDGSGISADENETIHFEWRRVGERLIKVRCVDRIPAPDGWTVEEIAEDRQWRQVEYDFIVPVMVNVPVVIDVDRVSNPNFPDEPVWGWQFLECFQYRFGDPLRLLEPTARSTLENEDRGRLVVFKIQVKDKPWWKFW